MEKRSIGTNIILCIITCGIYGWFWFYQINNTACQVNPNEWSTDGGTAIILSILTCGIYDYYWSYKMGKAMRVLPGAEDNSILYLVLSILGLGIVNYCIMQSDINRNV